MIRMIATTMSSSINENPFRLRIGFVLKFVEKSTLTGFCLLVPAHSIAFFMPLFTAGCLVPIYKRDMAVAMSLCSVPLPRAHAKTSLHLQRVPSDAGRIRADCRRRWRRAICTPADDYVRCRAE